VEIPAGEGEIHVQDGRLLPYADVDPFRPHCAEDPNLVRTPARGALLAGLRLAGGPSQWMYATELYLEGTGAGPGLWRVRCGHWEDPSLDPRFLTLDEIRAALGGIASLESP